MKNDEMLNNFKAYRERLKKEYEACNDEKEKKSLEKKISDCEALIHDFE